MRTTERVIVVGGELDGMKGLGSNWFIAFAVAAAIIGAIGGFYVSR